MRDAIQNVHQKFAAVRALSDSTIRLDEQQHVLMHRLDMLEARQQALVENGGHKLYVSQMLYSGKSAQGNVPKFSDF